MTALRCLVPLLLSLGRFASGSDQADMVLDNLYVDRYRDKGQFSYGYVIRPDEDQTNNGEDVERLAFAVRHLRDDDGSQNWGYVMGKSVAPSQKTHNNPSSTTGTPQRSLPASAQGLDYTPKSAPASGGTTASPIHELGASDTALAASSRTTAFTFPTTFPTRQAALPEYATHPSTIQPVHGGNGHHFLDHHGLRKVYVRRPGETLESIGTDLPVVFESRPEGIVVDDLTIIPAADGPPVNDWTARPSPVPLHSAADPLLYHMSHGGLPQELALALEGSEHIDRVVVFDDQLQHPQQARRFLPQHNSHNNVYNRFAGLNTERGPPTVQFGRPQYVQPLVRQEYYAHDPNAARHAPAEGLSGFGAGRFIDPYYGQQAGLSARSVHGDPSNYRIVSYGTPDVSQSRQYGEFLTHQGDHALQESPPHHLNQGGRSFTEGSSQRAYLEPDQRRSDYAIPTENDPVYALPPDDYSKSQSLAGFGSDREDAGYLHESPPGADRESSDMFGRRTDDVRRTSEERPNTVTISTMSFRDPLKGEKVLVRRRKVKQSSQATTTQASMYEDDALAQEPVTDSPPNSHQSRAFGAGRATTTHEARDEPEYGGLAASFGETGPEGIDDAVIFSDEYATTLAPSYGQRTGGSLRRRLPKAVITSPNLFQNVGSRVFHRQLPDRSEYGNGFQTDTRTVNEDTSSVHSQVRYRNDRRNSNRRLPITTQVPLTTAESTDFVTERQTVREARPLSPPPTRQYARTTKQPIIQSQYGTVSSDDLEDANLQPESSLTKRPRTGFQRPRLLRNRIRVNNRKSLQQGSQTAPDIHDVAASVEDTGGEQNDSPERSRGWKARLKAMLDQKEGENTGGHSRRQSFMDHIKSMRKFRISHTRPRAEGALEEEAKPLAHSDRNGKEAGEVHPVTSALVASGPPEDDIPKSSSSSHTLNHRLQPNVKMPSRISQTRSILSEQSSKKSEVSQGGRRSRLLLPRIEFPKRGNPSGSPAGRDFSRRLRRPKIVQPEDSDTSKAGDNQRHPGIVWPSQSVTVEDKGSNESARKIVPVRRLRRPKIAQDHSSPLSDNRSPDQKLFYEPENSEMVSDSVGSQEHGQIARPRHDALEEDKLRDSVRERLRSHHARHPKIVMPQVRPLHEEPRPEQRFGAHVLHPNVQSSEQREDPSEDYSLKSSSNRPNRPETAEPTVPPLSRQSGDQDESESITHQWHHSQAPRWNTAVPAETTETPFVTSRLGRWGRRLFTPSVTRDPLYTTTSLPDTSLGRPELEEGNVGEESSSRHSSQGRDRVRPSTLFSSRWETRKRLNRTANNDQLSPAAKSSERPTLGKGLLTRLRALMVEQGTRHETSKEQEPLVKNKASYSVDVSFSETVSSTDAEPHYPKEVSLSALSHHEVKNTSHAEVDSSADPVGFKSLFHRNDQSGSDWSRPEQDRRHLSPTVLQNSRGSEAHGLGLENSSENSWIKTDQSSQSALQKFSGINEHVTVAPVVIQSFGAHISRFGPTTTSAGATEHTSFAFAPHTSRYSPFKTTPSSIPENYPSSQVSAANSDGIVRAPSRSLSVEELTQQLREQVLSKESNTVKPTFAEPVTPALPVVPTSVRGTQLYSFAPTEASKDSHLSSVGTQTPAPKSLSYLPEVGANSGPHSSHDWGTIALPKRDDASQEADAPASSAQSVQGQNPSGYLGSGIAVNSNAGSTESNEERARLGSFRDQLLQTLEQDKTTTERPLSVEELTQRLRQQVLSEGPSTVQPTFTEDVTSELPVTVSVLRGTRLQKLDSIPSVTHAPSSQDNPVTISDESAWKVKAILDDSGSPGERQWTATTRAIATDVTVLPPAKSVGDHFQLDNEIRYASDSPAPGDVSTPERPLVVMSGWNSDDQNSVELELSRPEEQFLLDEEERLLAAGEDGVRVGRLSTVGSTASFTTTPALVMVVTSVMLAAVV